MWCAGENFALWYAEMLGETALVLRELSELKRRLQVLEEAHVVYGVAFRGCSGGHSYVEAFLTTPLVCETLHLDLSLAGADTLFFHTTVNTVHAREFVVTYKRNGGQAWQSVYPRHQESVNVPPNLSGFLHCVRNKYAKELVLSCTDRGEHWSSEDLVEVLRTVNSRFPQLERVVLAEKFSGWVRFSDFPSVKFVYRPLGLLSCDPNWKLAADTHANVFVEPASAASGGVTESVGQASGSA